MNRQQKRIAKAKGDPAQTARPDDLDTVYQPELTGKDIDAIGNIFDQVIRASGIQGSMIVLPLLEKITAPRKAAMAAKK